MTNDKLIDAYREAIGEYEAAKAGNGSRVETFTRFLVAEKVLSARLGGLIGTWSISGSAIHRDPATRRRSRHVQREPAADADPVHLVCHASSMPMIITTPIYSALLVVWSRLCAI